MNKDTLDNLKTVMEQGWFDKDTSQVVGQHIMITNYDGVAVPCIVEPVDILMFIECGEIVLAIT